jgi:serine/threonine-protein kinase ULK/ATG1
MILARKFRIIREIGRGAYGVVYSAQVIAPFPPLKVDDFVAIKSIAAARVATPEDREKLDSEIAIMNSLEHPNLVKLYCVERSRNHFYLVMEFCGAGDLMTYLRSFQFGIPEPTIRNIAHQIATGLHVLHDHRIVHRDLKPQNILISSRGSSVTLKIADFGFARFLRPSDLAETICGSPMYMAPEIQFGQKYGASVDMWSLGVILYELVCL